MGNQQLRCCASGEGCKTALPISLQVSALCPALPVADIEEQKTIQISNILQGAGRITLLKMYVHS